MPVYYTLSHSLCSSSLTFCYNQFIEKDYSPSIATYSSLPVNYHPVITTRSSLIVLRFRFISFSYGEINVNIISNNLNLSSLPKAHASPYHSHYGQAFVALCT
jgi:hypothetical protein